MATSPICPHTTPHGAPCARPKLHAGWHSPTPLLSDMRPRRYTTLPATPRTTPPATHTARQPTRLPAVQMAAAS